MNNSRPPDHDDGKGKGTRRVGERPCRICGNSAENRQFRAREMMFGTGDEFDYVQCSKCGCLQIGDIPADMSKYYPTGYYSMAATQGRAAGLKERALFWRDRFAYSGRGILGRIVFGFLPNPALIHVRTLGLPLDARVLDVGSGEGRNLRVLARCGYTHLTGIDPYLPGDVEDGPNLKILKRVLEEWRGEFDLVMLHHTLEHMPDQRRAFASIARLLAPDGVALVRVPTASSYAWERYGVHWVGLDAPRHFFLHSIRSLEILAEESGLHMASITWDSTSFQFWASDQYEKGIPLTSTDSLLRNPLKLALRYRRIKDMRKRAERLNEEERGDQVAVRLVKGGGAPGGTLPPRGRP